MCDPVSILGYALYQKSYRCYDLVNKRTYVTMDITFLESDTYDYPSLSNSSIQWEMQNEQLNWLQFEQPNFHDTKIQVNEETLTLLDVFSDEKPLIRLNVHSDDIALRVKSTLPNMEIESSLSFIPEGPSPKNIPEINSLFTHQNSNDTNTSVGYTLPFKHNYGKPPNRYSSDVKE